MVVGVGPLLKNLEESRLEFPGDRTGRSLTDRHAVGVSRNTVRKYLGLIRAEVEDSEVEDGTDPRATLTAIVRDEYDWERGERERRIGFADRPM